jgi:aminomethyltransferase
MCYEHGGMIDDGTLFRLGENNFRWIGGDDYGGVWLREQADKLGLKAWVRSSTNQLHNVAVQGPKSRDILREIVWTPPAQPTVEELGRFRFTIGRIGGFEGAPVVVSRTGYTGELGYEVFCHPKDALTVFDAIWQAGEPHGLMPLGLQALDMVRIEAGLAFAGYEFCDQTDPFEAGIGFTVPLAAKNENFIGREALLRRKEHPQKTLVGLEMEGDETVGHGDCVHIGRAQIGVVTSATRSPILKKTIALARLDVTHAGIGTDNPALLLKSIAQRNPSIWIRGSHAHCLFAVKERLVHLTFSQKRRTEIVLGIPPVGLHLQGRPIMSNGIVDLASLEENKTEIRVGHPAFGVFYQGGTPKRFNIDVRGGLPPRQRPQACYD